MILNALGYPGLETLGALSFGIRLEVVGTEVSAASHIPLEETSTGEFITGCNQVFIV